MKGTIIIITPLFPPSVGGPAKQAFFLKEFLEAEGNNVVVFSFDQEKSSKVKKYFSFFKKIVRVTHSGDTLVVFDELTLGFVALLVSKVRKVKMIVRLGGDRLWEKAVEEGAIPAVGLTAFYKEGFYKNVYPILRFIRNQVMSRADILVFSSLWYRDVLASAVHVSREKTRLIKNKKEGVVGRKLTPELKYQFIYAGRFTKVKNIENLLKAYSLISKEMPGSLLLCGNGPEEKNIQSFVKHNNLEGKVRVLGPQNKKELEDFIGESAVCVLPSLSDISPNFLLECQDLGKPALAPEEVGIRDDLRGVLYVDTKNTKTLAQDLLKISTPSYQEKLKEEILNSRNENHDTEWQENWRSIISL
jgi:glycosyltransferase involved in cell wall biosynthesis